MRARRRRRPPAVRAGAPPAPGRRAPAGEAGQGLIELALALPVLLALAGAIIDGAWAFHQAGLVAAAAEAAQRAVAIEDTGAGHCAGAPPPSYAGTALGAAAAAAPTLDPGRLSVALRYLEPACAGRMRTLAVSVTYPATAMTPWLAPLLSGRRFTGQAGSAVEELPPPWWGQAGLVQAQQAEIAALTSAYGQEAALVRAQQAEIASLVSAYRAAEAQVASLSSAVGDYYTWWQHPAAVSFGGPDQK